MKKLSSKKEEKAIPNATLEILDEEKTVGTQH